MQSEGRGGPPSRGGFISGSLASDLNRFTDKDRQSERAEATSPTSNGEIHQEDLPAESSLLVVRDLKKSGLETRDIQARVLGAPEKASCRVPQRGEGYVIPYYDINGNPLTFYRARVLNADYATNGVKYKQPQKTPNHIYFPRTFRRTLSRYVGQNPHRGIIIITEGEKKAACVQKFGFPAVAISGVDSWRSRTIILPEDTEFYSTTSTGDDHPKRRGPVRARLPSTDTNVPELVTLARGFGDLLDTITQYHLHPIIIYDSDNLGTLKAEVQRAATMLAYEFVYLGIHSNRIKQIVLPSLHSLSKNENENEILEEDRKTGLDDYMMQYGPEALEKLITNCLSDPKAFPRHPNPKGFISAQLQNRMSRKSMQQVASMILTELDAAGLRLREKSTSAPYYYDRDNAILMPAKLLNTREAPFHEQPFGTLLYQRYGISANDSKVLTWLSSQFTGEDPIEDVTPRRVLCLITEREDSLNPHGVALQISDSQYISVSPSQKEPIKVHTNGDLGILFEQDQVDPSDIDLIIQEFDQQLSEAEEAKKLEPWWQDIINESAIGLSIDNDATPDENGIIAASQQYHVTQRGREVRAYATLLFYISPFLLRWRGLQLPIELTVGGPGSGKSSLYSLRLQILTGRPKLRNIPTDIRDWQASLAHSGGLHVVDNVHFLNKELKQRISDELCRITTEPYPCVEMRKYFTNTDILRYPVNTTFAFTSIATPFHNEDLIQRSVTFNTEPTDREPKGNWVEDKLQERGGREAWIAHHLVFLHLFLKQQWDENFHTQHRLAHLEQSLSIASKVLNLSPPPQAGESESESTPLETSMGKILSRNQASQIAESDWVMRGIRAYLDDRFQNRKEGTTSERFFAAEISDWCLSEEEFGNNEILVNARKLGKYMSEHAQTLTQVLSIYSGGSYANRSSYRLLFRKADASS